MSQTKITNAGLKKLAGMKQLTHLLASVVALTWWRRRWRHKAEDLMTGGAA
ncbi:MAG: hypothetical protein HKN82_03975 [Akkermansiaceae bacterium]|nr:hypothetical protein [Akkermansiaceae bacterium]NNM28636.1 hypothetical protein [Akkermansiaceae bacterium]